MKSEKIRFYAILKLTSPPPIPSYGNFLKSGTFFQLACFLCEEVSELLDVLAGDVPDLRRRLGPVTQQTLDRDFSTCAVLPINCRLQLNMLFVDKK